MTEETNTESMQDEQQLKCIIEAALMVAGRPLTPSDMQKLFDEANRPDTKSIREICVKMQNDYENRGIELREIASGFQFQAKASFSPWLVKLWDERPPRYSRAVLETIALIAYRQPITRAEIEDVRGVGVSSHIVKTLLEREWIRVIGHKDVPGKPALYGTTKQLLDHLNLKSLRDLPNLAEIKDLESQEQKLSVQLELSQQLSEPDKEAEIADRETSTQQEPSSEDTLA